MSTGLVYKQVKDDIDLEILTLTSGEDAKAKNVLDKFKERLKNIEELSQPVMSRFVMDTARLFCRRGSRDGGAAKGLQRRRNEQRNPTVRASTGVFSAVVLVLANR